MSSDDFTSSDDQLKAVNFESNSLFFQDKMQFNFSVLKCFTECSCVSSLLTQHPVVQGTLEHVITGQIPVRYTI